MLIFTFKRNNWKVTSRKVHFFCLVTQIGVVNKIIKNTLFFELDTLF